MPLFKLMPDKNPSVEMGVKHKVPPLAEELLATDSWETKSQVFCFVLRAWLLVRVNHAPVEGHTSKSVWAAQVGFETKEKSYKVGWVEE